MLYCDPSEAVSDEPVAEYLMQITFQWAERCNDLLLCTELFNLIFAFFLFLLQIFIICTLAFRTSSNISSRPRDESGSDRIRIWKVTDELSRLCKNIPVWIDLNKKDGGVLDCLQLGESGSNWIS